MVVDTSAIIATMLNEPDADEMLRKMARTSVRHFSAVSYVECLMVLIGRMGEGAQQAVDAMLSRSGIVVSPVSLEQAKLAVTAFRQYGKGRHPAGLNFGDCFSYALAKSTGEPLLFKGTDFARTDIAVA